jgi:hypothetical protein
MLQKIQVGEFVVSEAGPLEAARLLRLSEKYTAMLTQATEKGEAATDDDVERLQALEIWPQVAACVTPLLEMDAWLQTPLATIGELREAAEMLNPDWFIVNDADVEKKSARKRHKPTSV